MKAKITFILDIESHKCEVVYEINSKYESINQAIDEVITDIKKDIINLKNKIDENRSNRSC